MDFTFETADDVVILLPTGNLVASEAERFKSHLEEMIHANTRYMLLDMSLIDFMDSSGLDAIMAINKRAAAAGGIFACAAPKENVHKIFRITWADQKVPLAPTRLDGLQMIKELRADLA